jgi:MFS family permease
MECSPLTNAQRNLVLIASFLGWMFAGLEISLLILIHRQAMSALLPADIGSSVSAERLVAEWFAWYQCAFLCGAAAGGWLFGTIGDRFGRTRAMAGSVVCYSAVTGLMYLASSPEQLMILRFVACLGVGGVWPNAVALVAEAWPNASRPLLAGLLGTAANVGFVLLGLIALNFEITPEAWRWVFLVGTSPIILGILIWLGVPESPRWRQRRRMKAIANQATLKELYRPPLLRRTLLGISVGAIPVIGTAANANWVVPWSDHVASQNARQSMGGGVARRPDYKAKARTQITRSSGAAIGSLLGGIVASLLGRRVTYFLISLGCLAMSTLVFRFLSPNHPYFHYGTFALGFVGVTYFGWLPLFLPELFPTRVRAAGTGISFNSGRVVAALVLLAVAAGMDRAAGDYSTIGFWTGMIYVVGMIVIWFAPPSTGKLDD